MELIHGGDWAGYESEYGEKPLDFSANISPLGLPEGVRRAVIESLELAQRYPDPLCRALRAKLGALHGLPAENIVCGNGAADLIFRMALALRPRRALVIEPGFAEYRRALETVGCEVLSHRLREAEGFALTERVLDCITPAVDIMFLCQPNNPTGLVAGPELLGRILDRCSHTGTLLAVDECFLDFVERPELYTLTGYLKEQQRLIIFKAFTKTYAMAGLRLGYALCGSSELAERIYSCGQPWAVSVPAQAAGLAALDELDYVKKLHRLISAQRRSLIERLSALGLWVLPGEANFLLFKSGDTALCEKLRPRGILLRSCANFPGIGPGWYRSAVRTEAENNILVQALEEVLQDG